MMEIKVLGPGCANCHKMEELAKAAVKNFRSRYPDYKLPDALEKLLPDSGP